MEVDRLADPEFHEEGRLRGFVLGPEGAEGSREGSKEGESKEETTGTGGFTMVGGAGKVCTDEMCEF